MRRVASRFLSLELLPAAAAAAAAAAADDDAAAVDRGETRCKVLLINRECCIN